MDKLTRYRETVRRVLEDYASWVTRNDVVAEVVQDPARDHFELLRFGWEGHRRIHSTMFHLDLINGKIWVQFDGTDRPIAEELVRAGVPKEDIVLAFHPAGVRPHTGYGVG